MNRVTPEECSAAQVSNPAKKQALLVAVALVCALWGARSCFFFIGPNSPHAVKYDLDCVWMLRGIEKAHTFADTLTWWTGPWSGEWVAYYRPLTSLLWWWEYQAFGPMGMQGFTAVHLVSHLFMVTLCALFLSDLLGWKRAFVAVCLWGLHIPRYLGVGNSGDVFPIWKDSCDIWCGICYITSLWLFLRTLEQGQKRSYHLSLFAFFVAILFKEMAYTLPLMILLLLWYKRVLQERYHLSLPYFGLAAVCVVYRFWALQGFGYKNGTNGAWWHRILVDLGGPPARQIISGSSFLVAVALVLIAFGCAGFPARRILAVILGMASLPLFWFGSVQAGLSVGELFATLVLDKVALDAVYVTLCLLLAVRFVLNHRREQWFGYGWVVISYIPLTTMAVGDHGFYLVALGWSVWLTEALDDGVVCLRHWFPELGRLELASYERSASAA